MNQFTAAQQIEFIYSPLVLSPGITVEGGVPDVQMYDIAAGTYEPDYTNTNLILKAGLEIADPDGVIPEGSAAMTNMKWTLLENNKQTLITASTAGFTVGSDGKLTVKRNCQGQNPMTLLFEAEYLDPRNGEIHRILETHVVDCQGVSQRPVLSLDTSGMIAYDPLRDPKTIRKVKASLTIGGTEVPAANRQFIWQKRDCDIDNQWANIDGTDILDYDVEVSADGKELSIKPWLIGYRIDVRCYAKYSPYGNPSTMPIDTKTPMGQFTVKRITGRLNASVKGAKRLKPGTTSITPELVVSDSKGVIPNSSEVLDVEWRTSTCVAAGTLNPGSVVAHGVKPTIPTTFAQGKFGGKLLPYYKPKDPVGGVTSGGFLLTFNGEILVV